MVACLLLVIGSNAAYTFNSLPQEDVSAQLNVDGIHFGGQRRWDSIGEDDYYFDKLRKSPRARHFETMGKSHNQEKDYTGDHHLTN